MRFTHTLSGKMIGYFLNTFGENGEAAMPVTIIAEGKLCRNMRIIQPIKKRLGMDGQPAEMLFFANSEQYDGWYYWLRNGEKRSLDTPKPGLECLEVRGIMYN